MMTVFRIISIVTSLGLVIFLSYRRFNAFSLKANEPVLFLVLRYFAWLGRAFLRFFKREAWLKIRPFFRDWLSLYPQAWQKFTFWGIVTTFLYLALSGFGFALLTSRGLFGLPLLLHVLCGGIFSLSLAGIVVGRARNYVELPPLRNSSEPLGSFSTTPRAPFFRSILFWILVLSGFSLALTALLSMLPYFTFEAQLDLIAVHRYSGLILFLSAVLFLDQAIPRQQA